MPRLYNGRKMSTRRRTSSRWKDTPEKSFDPSDIVLKSSTAKDEEMNKKAIDLLAKTLDKQLIENEVATSLKNSFDDAYGPTWNVIVGRNFGSHLTCIEYVHLSIAKISVIIFRCDSTPSKPHESHH